MPIVVGGVPAEHRDQVSFVSDEDPVGAFPPYDLGSNRASHSGSNALTTRLARPSRRSPGSRAGAVCRLPFGIYTRLTGGPAGLVIIDPAGQARLVLGGQHELAVDTAVKAGWSSSAVRR